MGAMKRATYRILGYGVMAGGALALKEWVPALLLLGLGLEAAWSDLLEWRFERVIEKLEGRRDANLTLAEECAHDLPRWREAFATVDAYNEAIEVVRETRYPEGVPHEAYE
jgi:hypothetical protein